MVDYGLYLAAAFLACFDNEGGDGAGDGAGTGDGATNDGAEGKEGDNKTFTQEQVNKFVAEDRRKTEAKFKAQLERAEKNYSELLDNKNLSEQERGRLDEALEDVRKQLRTKEQQAAHEKKQLEEQYTSRITEIEKRAVEWEGRYRESNITRALQDAAVAGEAFSPSQIVTILRPWTKMAEEVNEKSGKGTGQYKVKVEFPDVDPNTGEAIVTLRTPEEAVKRMKEVPELYGNLFKANVVSGIGSNSATGGLAPGARGQIDLRRLTPQQYREIREKNPELLGLRSRKGR